MWKAHHEPQEAGRASDSSLRPPGMVDTELCRGSAVMMGIVVGLRTVIINVGIAVMIIKDDALYPMLSWGLS